MRRRKVLVLAGSSMTAAIAGCGGGGEESGDDGESSDDGSMDNETGDGESMDNETGDGEESMDDGEESMDDSEESMDDGEESGDGSEEESEPVPATLSFTGGVKPNGTELNPGDEEDFTVVSSNDGDETLNTTYELVVNGSVVATQDQTLEGRALDTRGVTWTVPQDFGEGAYDITVRAEDQEATGSLTVAVEEESAFADLTISDVEGTPEDVMQEYFNLVDGGNFEEGYQLYHSKGPAFAKEEGFYDATEKAFISDRNLTLVSTERVLEQDNPPRIVLDGVQDFSGDESNIAYDFRPEEVDGTTVWRIWQFVLPEENELDDNDFRSN